MVETLGKYKIDGFIAEGGMARILRAKTEGVGGVEKVVALKCLKGSMQEDDNFVQMLLEEARITVRMTHKNICQVYGLEHDADKYFMVMEYVDGISLAQLCNYLFGKNRVFPIEAAVFIAMEVCSGLSYAHRMTDDNGEPLEIVHRDVNPQNICISKEGEVKLIDFGIAKAKCVSTETMAGTIKGKFNYMSPEQARGDRVDQRADVFALGAVLYEMLSGHMLYPLSLDDARLRTKTRMADFVPIETYLPDIPEKLKKIIAKALTRDLTQRFPTSRDFLLALTQFSHDACKVYDALNLSMLVEKCISETRNSHDTLDGAAVLHEVGRSSDSHYAKVESGPIYASEEDHTTLMQAPGAALDEAIAEAAAAEDSSTSVFDKSKLKEIVGTDNDDDENTDKQQISAGDTLSFAFNRSVNLDINDVGADSTMMVSMDDVKRKPIQPLKAMKAVFDRILSVDEKTLFIAAISLIAILIVAIVIFISVDSGDKNAPQPATTQQADGMTVRIDSNPPGAELLFEGKPIGLTTPTDVPVDKETVTVKMPFYHPHTLNLKEIEGSTIVDLDPIEGRVSIESMPNGATVIVTSKNSDGKSTQTTKGTTPITIKLPMNQSYKIALEKEGYKMENIDLEWNEDEPVLKIYKNLKAQ